MNLYYGSLRGTAFQWLDVGALCRKLVPRNRVNRIRYFTARVSARPDDPDAPVRQAAYLRALGTVAGLTVHVGHFQHATARLPVAEPSLHDGQATAEVLKSEEKGSDVNLAAYLLLDAFRNDCDLAVVVSNDSDLEEPIRVTIQELGVPVGVVNPHAANRRSRKLLKLDPLFFKQVRPSALSACQFADVLSDVQGEIRRPAIW